MYDTKQLSEILSQLTDSRHFWVAFSGGLDSHVLLHSMASLRQMRPDFVVSAIHIHHGLSSNADAWAKHCEAICQNLGVECVIKKVDARPTSKQSPEDAARRIRYETFAQIIPPSQCLLTAHTSNDQAETVLLQLLRGAGPRGLAAMPQKIVTGHYDLIRPLLQFTREELQSYASTNQLNWIEDESNNDRRFDRNYLRHEILPGLIQRWPKLNTVLARSAQHCAEASDLLDELAANDFAQISEDGHTLVVSQLLKLNPARQKNILRFWLKRLRLPAPDTIKLKQLQRDLLHCSMDAQPKIAWMGVEVRRYQDHLYAMPPLLPHDPSLILHWEDIRQPLPLPANLGTLHLSELTQQGLVIPHNTDVTIRFRQGGEICHPVNRQGSHPLKKLFQEWNVPPWRRDRIPLIYCDQQLAAVVGYCIVKNYYSRL